MSSGEPRPALDVPAEVADIARRLDGAGFETWAVGGAVRDAFLGGHPLDWDLATAARPRDVQRLFRRTVPVGVSHGTVGVLGPSGRLHEVTTFRRDVETDGRHARVAFADTVEEDLGRRDFTINALAWHPLTRELRDPHGGLADLAAGRLRTVGTASERFREDRLRVLRAMRFAGRFGLRIDAATWEAARDSAGELPHLSPERVREELLKVLREVRPPSRSLELYRESGALATLYPELESTVPDGGWARALAAVDAAGRHRPLVRVAALLHPAGPAAADAVVRRLRFSNAEANRVVHLVAQEALAPAADAPAPVLRRWLRRVGRAYVDDVFRLRVARVRAGTAGPPGETVRLRRRARAELRAGVPLEVGEMAIGGAELRSLGVAPGPAFGEILRGLLERVTDDPSLNEPGRLLALARERVEGRRAAQP